MALGAVMKAAGSQRLVHSVTQYLSGPGQDIELSLIHIWDMDTIDLELVVADLEMVERRIDKAKKMAKRCV